MVAQQRRRIPALPVRPGAHGEPRLLLDDAESEGRVLGELVLALVLARSLGKDETKVLKQLVRSVVLGDQELRGLLVLGELLLRHPELLLHVIRLELDAVMDAHPRLAVSLERPAESIVTDHPDTCRLYRRGD